MSTTATTRTSPGRAVLRAESRLFRREPGNLFWILGFPPLLLVILGSIPSFRKPDEGLGGLRLIDVYVPILVLVALIVTGLQAMPPVITGYRERGILRRMSATPVRPSALLSAQMGLNGAAALVSALVCMAIGRLAFDVRLPQQAFGYALALLLTAAAALAPPRHRSTGRSFECLTGDQECGRRTENAGGRDGEVRCEEGANDTGQGDADALDRHQTAGLDSEEPASVRRVDGLQDQRVDTLVEGVTGAGDREQGGRDRDGRRGDERDRRELRGQQKWNDEPSPRGRGKPRGDELAEY
jgi:hypothetical protein